MKKLPVFILLAVCAAGLFGQAKPRKGSKTDSSPPVQAAPKVSALDKTTLENYVRHLQAWDHTITVEVGDPKPGPVEGFYEINVHGSKDQASQDLLFYVSKDGRHILQGTFYETAENPFKPDLDKLKGMTALAPNYGTPGAPVVIVEFSDFECPYCRDEAKSLRSNLLTVYPKQVRLYHIDMPLEAVHPWARAAATAGRCVYKQNAGTFWDYYDWIYGHQEEITLQNLKAKVLEWAKGKEAIDSLQLNRCIDTKETDAEVSKGLEDAKSLLINQTPTFFVNGRRMSGAIEWPTMKHVIDDEIEYQKTAKNAGEDCGCSVTLPSVGGAPASTPLGGLK